MGELEKLTKEVAKQQVEKITEFSDDAEFAHENEDSLHYWFIECVAAGMYKKGEATEIATIVKSTSLINFTRWYG